MQAYNDKGTGNYKDAKRSGNLAIYLTLINIIYTLVVDTLIVGLTLPLHCEFLHVNMSWQHMLSNIQSNRSLFPRMLKDPHLTQLFVLELTKLSCCTSFYDYYSCAVFSPGTCMQLVHH